MSTSTPSITELPLRDAGNLSHEDARTYYTWSNFFQALAADVRSDTRQKYFHVRELVNEQEDCEKCDKWVSQAFTSSPAIRFLSEQISLIGPSLLPEHIRCRRCPSISPSSNMPTSSPAAGASASDSPIPMAFGGGFNVDYGILLCANHMKSKSHLEDTLAHEMVHAWDHLKFKVGSDNMRHQACTEIRASTLSGECRFTKEVWGRGQWTLVQQMQECVRRRAVLSMMGRPSIRAKEQNGDRGKAEAERVVGEVWESCFNDTRPYDEIFR